MNQCILTGNLGNDPESFFTNEGTQIVSFDMAFKSGKERTSWIKVKCFNKLAEVAEKYLHKGAKIAISASLDQNKWENDEGQKRSIMQLIGHNIEFIKTDGRGFDGEEQSPDGDTPF